MSLSNTRVISLLNQYFVPAYLSNEDYTPEGSAPPAEKAELRRIHKEGHEKKLSVGSVHVYILGPDGHLINSLHTARVTKDLIPMLEAAVQGLGTAVGKPVIQPSPMPVPKVEAGALRLHLTARYLQRKGADYVLTGQDDTSGDWSALPSEDWITLKRSEWVKLLPPSSKSTSSLLSSSWQVDKAVASQLLKHFYPPTENWDVSTNRIDAQTLTAKVVSINKGIGRIRLEGHLKMEHPFYHKDDDKFVAANVLGYLDFNVKDRSIESLRMVTDGATYGNTESRSPFGVALRMVP